MCDCERSRRERVYLCVIHDHHIGLPANGKYNNWSPFLPPAKTIMPSERRETKDNGRDCFIMLVCPSSAISNCLTKGLKVIS